MNFVTRSEFREVLLALFNDIQHLRKEVRNSAQGQHANRKPQEPVFTITKIDPISSIETHTPVSEQTTQKNYHFWSLVTQWSTFGIVALYTTVAALQWCAVKEANKIARDSLEAQTRPWIGIPKIELTEQKDTGSVDLRPIPCSGMGFRGNPGIPVKAQSKNLSAISKLKLCSPLTYRAKGNSVLTLLSLRALLWGNI